MLFSQQNTLYFQEECRFLLQFFDYVLHMPGDSHQNVIKSNCEVGEQVYPGYSCWNLGKKTRQIIYLSFHILLWLHYLLYGKQQIPKHYRGKDVLLSITVTFEITKAGAKIMGL